MELIRNTALICMVILILMLTTSRPCSTIDPRSGRQIRYATLLVFAFGFVLTFVASFRMYFQDTVVYKGLYSSIGTDFAKAYDETNSIKDVGFNLLMIFLNRINSDPQFLIIVTSCVIIPTYVYTINKYAWNVPFSLLLFFLIEFVGTMNGVRQVLACSLAALALPLVRDKRTVPYILWILLLSSLHKSALILIPIYFVVSGRRMNLGIWLFLIMIVAFFLSPSTANSLMSSLLEDTVYADYMQVDSQMGIMRFLVALAPIVLILVYCWVQSPNHHGEDKHSSRYFSQRMIDVLINMQIVSFGFTTLGLRMVYFARVSMYFNCTLPLLLPVVIQGSLRPKSRRFMNLTVIFLYTFFFIYQIYTYSVLGDLDKFVLNL